MSRVSALAATFVALAAAGCATAPPGGPVSQPSSRDAGAERAPVAQADAARDAVIAALPNTEADPVDFPEAQAEPDAAVDAAPTNITVEEQVDPAGVETAAAEETSPDAPPPPNSDNEPPVADERVDVAMVDPAVSPPPAAIVEPQAQPERAATPPANASHAEVVQTVANLFGVSGEDYLRSLIETALLADQALLGPCEERGARPVRTDALAPVDQIMQALAGSRGAVIRERVEVAGCEQRPRLHNIVPLDDEMTGVRFEAFVPGLTHASLKLQLDAVRQAVVQAAGSYAARYEDCDAMASAPWVVDTQGGAMPVPGEPWSEDWELYVCGERHGLELTFEPTESGVTFSASIPLEE